MDNLKKEDEASKDTNSGNDKRDDRKPIDCLLRPRKIAVVGASTKSGSPGNIILKQIKQAGIEVFPVNPKEKIIEDIEVVPSVAQLPSDIDLAVITTAAKTAEGLTLECIEHGIPAIIPIAGGFGEVSEEGKEAERRMVEAARRKGARILGPNTLGVWVPATGLNTIFVKQEASFTGGTISFITQSGSVGVVSTDNASLAGFRLGAFVGLGNKCDLDELDFLEYFGKDENTKTIMLYLESFNDGKKLMKLCSEITLRKPVVILKAGRTARGSSAASSHTGKLAGSDLVVDAAIRQSGCIRANDDEELVDFAKVLDMARPLRGNRIAVVTSAGGYGVMATDYIESDEFGVGMRMATFSEQTKAKLREVVFSFASVGNPIDLTATCDNSTYDKVLSILQEEEDVDAILCVTFFQPALLTPDLLNIVAKHAVSGRKPLVALTIGGTEALKHLQKFTELGVPAFNSTRRAIKALQALYLRGQYLIKKGVVF